MSERHLFPGKMVDSIIACKVVTINFSEHITVLAPVRTNWTPAYATELTTRVDTVTATYMGVKARDALFQATATLNKLVGPAKDDLATVKNSITLDFKENEVRRDQLLLLLGLKKVNISALTQSQLVALLVTFKRELTPAILTEITAQGLPASVVNGIVAYTDTIVEANAAQEALKNSTKEASATVVKEINKLYTEIIKICRIAANHFKDDSAMKQMFTFSRILKNVATPHASKEVTTTDATASK